MREKIASYIGFARRSRQLLSGFQACQEGLRKRKIKVLIIAEDLAPGTRQKLVAAADSENIKWCAYGTIESLSEMAGQSNRGVFGVTDSHLAAAILKEAEQRGRKA